MADCGKGLEARDYRDVDSGFAAFVAEAVEDFIVKEHLGDDVVGSGIDLALEVGDVRAEVRGFEVLLRVGSDADAEVGGCLGLELLDRGDEFVGVSPFIAT